MHVSLTKMSAVRPLFEIAIGNVHLLQDSNHFLVTKRPSSIEFRTGNRRRVDWTVSALSPHEALT